MSAGGCWVKIHFCCNESSEISQWDVACDVQDFDWGDTFAKIRLLACTGSITQQFESSIRQNISTMLSKGSKHARMYILPPIDATSALSTPLEVVDEDMNVRKDACYFFISILIANVLLDFFSP